MGSVLLIGHLFNRRVVNHNIVHVCVQQLLSGGTGKISGEGSNAHVHENCIECACELVFLTAQQLGENEASNKLVASYLARLDQLLDKSLSTRVKFLIKDVQLATGLMKVLLKRKAPEDDDYGAKDVKRMRGADQ